MKKVLIVAGIIVIISIGVVLGLWVRPTIEQAENQIDIELAPFIIEFRNDNWIDGAILAENYEEQTEYIKVINYYDRHGLHNEVKYIPKEWIISISYRR